ncbi:MAG TPA: PAS domain S-box protein, partial [Gammaproteobacteria bacterium]
MLYPVTHNISEDEPSYDAGIGWLQLDALGRVKSGNDAAARILGYANLSALLAARRVFDEFVATVFAVSLSVPASGRWRAFVVENAGGRPVSVYACPESIEGDSINMRLVGGAPAEWFSPQLLGGCDLSLLELSQSGLYIKSLDCQLLYVNRAHEDMLGYDPGEMVGMQGRNVIAERDLPQVNEVLFGKPWRAGEMREMQVRMRMKDDIGLRHVIIRQGRIMHEGREAFIGSVRDVTDQRRGEQALRDYAKRLRRTSQQVLEVQESERRNLARELHDEIGQQLTLVKLSLGDLAPGPEQAAPLNEAMSAVSTLLQQVRDLSLDLRPSMLDDLGLDATLRWYVSRIARLAVIETRLGIDSGFPRLSPGVETLFFRVAQEAITNVMRHAQATTLEVRLVCHRGGVE